MVQVTNLYTKFFIVSIFLSALLKYVLKILKPKLHKQIHIIRYIYKYLQHLNTDTQIYSIPLTQPYE